MVVININDHGRIVPVLETQPVFTQFNNGVFVRKHINRAMQFNSFGNTRTKLLNQISPLHKITNKIADLNIRVAAGEIKVREEVHGASYLILPIGKKSVFLAIKKIYLKA